MFGFTMLQGDVFPIKTFGSIFSDEFLQNLSGFDKTAELEGATLLDTHHYTVDKLTYEQKVYRLKDNSIFVETKHVIDGEIVSLNQQLDKAIVEQRFEDAAILRDKIAELNKN